MKYLMPIAALFFVTACSQTGKVAYPISELTERRAPTLTHVDVRHEWDDSKSFALNVAQLDGGRVSLRDVELPEAAQREITGGYRLRNFLINAWAGSATEAAFLDSIPRNRRDAYRFDPYAIVFVDADVYNSELKDSKDGGFAYVFEKFSSETVAVLQNEYEDETVKALMWNKAAGDLWLAAHNRRWTPDTDFVITFHGGACEASTEARALTMRDYSTGQTYAEWALGGLAAPENCNIFGEVTPLGYVPLKDGEKYAFKIKLSNNYFVPAFTYNTDVTWVVSTYWKDGNRYQQSQFPLVTYGGRGWLFTHSNDSIDL